MTGPSEVAYMAEGAAAPSLCVIGLSLDLILLLFRLKMSEICFKNWTDSIVQRATSFGQDGNFCHFILPCFTVEGNTLHTVWSKDILSTLKTATFQSTGSSADKQSQYILIHTLIHTYIHWYIQSQLLWLLMLDIFILKSLILFLSACDCMYQYVLWLLFFVSTILMTLVVFYKPAPLGACYVHCHHLDTFCCLHRCPV